MTKQFQPQGSSRGRPRNLLACAVSVILLAACQDQKKEVVEPKPAPASAVEEKPAPALSLDLGAQVFKDHCSGCHGIHGDGAGTTELKNPARSFAAGGFAFGNTPEALFRTVTNGMPGQSEMPSFGKELSKKERLAVVTHVRTLIPQEKIVDDVATIMEVKDRPVAVRGILPGLMEDQAVTPRGLLLGLPGGTTFQFRIDDVRLLAVRTGGFVKRTDWTGRAGTPANPTGVVKHLVGSGNPGPTFARFANDQIVPLPAQLAETMTLPDLAAVRYRLGEKLSVVEAVHGQKVKKAFAYTRQFLIGACEDHLILTLDEGQPDQVWHGRDLDQVSTQSTFPSVPLAAQKPAVRINSDGSALVIVTKGIENLRLGTRSNAIELQIPAHKAPQDLQVVVIQMDRYDVEVLAQLSKKVIWK